ncbi:MAG: TIGR02449 family protein [Gammaproteobacteria bacterium]|nr:TIGR02449 family protein [Gammaproteobacteria bacterium]
MSKDGPVSTSEGELKPLEVRIDELIRESERLKSENMDLRKRHALLQSERAALMETTTQVRSRMQGVMDRLRTLERET